MLFKQKKWLLSGGLFMCVLTLSIIIWRNSSTPDKTVELMQKYLRKPVSSSQKQTCLSPHRSAKSLDFSAIGYTSCPDICPLTLSHLRDIYPILSEKLPNFQVLFISVDPHRDTPEKLGEYLNFFHPEFLFASASHDILYPMTQELGLQYAITQANESNNYYVDHTASLALISPEAEMRARFTPVDPTQDTRTFSGFIKGY